MVETPRLAFVDLETTGLGPQIHRITEIGVITVDAGHASEWTTLINPRLRSSMDSRRRSATARCRMRN